MRVQPKSGGILHPKLNIDTRPIAYKYREGKMQRTLKRELKVRETVEREADKVPLLDLQCPRTTTYQFDPGEDFGCTLQRFPFGGCG